MTRRTATVAGAWSVRAAAVSSLSISCGKRSLRAPGGRSFVLAHVGPVGNCQRMQKMPESFGYCSMCKRECYLDVVGMLDWHSCYQGSKTEECPGTGSEP